MVQFYKGLKSQYNYPTNSVLKDAIFFATDTGEILVNGVNYGTDLEKVKDVSFNNDTNTFIFTKANGTQITAALGDKLLTAEDRKTLADAKEIFESGGSLNINYVSKLDGDVAMVNAVGGIAAGTTVSQLSNVKTLSDMFDELLFPTIQPTATAPTASLSLTGYANLQEVGAAGPVASNFNKSWNKGSIKIGNTVKGDRAGEMDHDVLYVGTETVTTLPEKVAKGTTNYYYKVYYTEGPQPLDSKGNNATTLTKLAAGSVTSSAVAVNGVYPFYANVNNASASKLPLTNSTTFTCKLAAEGPNKHVIKLPHNITKIEMLNTLSNQYEVYGLENFTKTTEQIDVNDDQVQYNVYTRNDDGYNGETTYQITYTK